MTDSIFQWSYFAGLIVGSIIRGNYTRIRGNYTRHHRHNEIVDDRKSTLDTVLMTLPAVGMFILPLVNALSGRLDFADYRLPTWVGWLGILTFALALWLLWRSHVDLGRNWSPTVQLRKDHTLVTRGVYQHVRHPMYAAHFVWGIAQPMLLQNWIAGWGMLLTLLPGYLWRVPREERQLLDRFGDQYASYTAITGRIVPPLRR